MLLSRFVGIWVVMWCLIVLVTQGVGSHVMVNGFAESEIDSDVNESVFQGIAHVMVGGVRVRSVDGKGAGNVSESGILNGVRVHDVNGMRVSGVNESIVVNDVRANGSVGVTGGFGSSLGQAVRVRNVSELVSQGMVNAVGASSVTETVMVDTVRDNDVSGVRINGVNESVSVNDVRAMNNDVRTNSGVGVTGVSSVGKTVMVDVVRGNDVNDVRINGVNDSVVVNDVRPNGVCGSVYRGMGNGVRINGGVGVTDGSGSSLGQALVDHTGQLDKDRLLGWFNQEVDAAATIRFWERMQLEDVEKGTRALLMMKETEVNIGEKASVFWGCLVVVVVSFGDGFMLSGSCPVMSLRFIVNSKQLMARLPRCHELHRSCCSKEWEDMFILYCRRAVVEDSSLASEINELCVGLTSRIEEREYFIDELDSASDVFVPEKMTEFLKET
ncbi:hypothetical protein Tco_0938738 [Tanacetum coccineum]|uniref:Uncharacterized protein n=1 Tax=Tanacetum coccineum TaxID=301880 RepID=A0ABQ5DJ05_9ASTR